MAVSPRFDTAVDSFGASCALCTPSSSGNGFWLEQPKVLVVDDHPASRMTAAALLAVEGYEVLEAENGPAALNKVIENKPDVILLDVMMPGMDGPETLRELRKFPELEQTPVVFMTAKVQPQEVQEYLAMGALAVIAKPFDPMTLAEELRAIWAKRKN